jgi:energy-coupling factor transporter ATP-binding protein EcfA2
MIERLYVHNFRCLENFELTFKGEPSVLLVGKNGAGKSTVAAVLQIFQKIGLGYSRVEDLLSLKDFAQFRTEESVRFELEMTIDEQIVKYILVLQVPNGYRKLKVREESLLIGGTIQYSRTDEEFKARRDEAMIAFDVDWNVIVLSILQEKRNKSVEKFKKALASIIVLEPVPKLMSGTSSKRLDLLLPDASNFGDWFFQVLASHPSSYRDMDSFLLRVFPDFDRINTQTLGVDVMNLQLAFGRGATKIELSFDALSSGEKCLVLAAVLLGVVASAENVVCFWDEPDAHLSLSEIEQLTMALRRTFAKRGQCIVSSNNAEVIHCFAPENTYLLDRASHLEPTRVKLVSELANIDDLVGALATGFAL